MQRKPSPEPSEPKANWRSETGQRCQTSSLAQESCYFCHLMSTTAFSATQVVGLCQLLYNHFHQPLSNISYDIWHFYWKLLEVNKLLRDFDKHLEGRWNNLTWESDHYCDPITPSGVFQISQHHHHLGMLSWTPHSLKEHHRWWSESRDINFLNNVRELK